MAEHFVKLRLTMDVTYRIQCAPAYLERIKADLGILLQELPMRAAGDGLLSGIDPDALVHEWSSDVAEIKRSNAAKY